MEIIGHRGASFDAPENTLASFRRGWEQHADAVELDIRQTKDGRIVVIHDQDTQRVTGVNRLVEEQTLEEIRQLDAGVWKDSRWVGEKVPLLSEALALVPAGKRLFIEVKCGIAVVPELVREIHAANQQPTQTVVIGFCSKTMAAVKSLLPAVEVYLVANISSHRWVQPRAISWLMRQETTSLWPTTPAAASRSCPSIWTADYDPPRLRSSIRPRMPSNPGR